MTDRTRIQISTDPRERRFSGTTHHGNIYFDVPFISEIVPGLWQGGCEEGLTLPREITHLVSLYPWERYWIGHDMGSELYLRVYDAEDGFAIEQVDQVARWVNLCRQDGAVLIHCQAGLNRSSFVAARALMLEGMSAAEAIELIRGKRSPAALCNKSFEEQLLSR